jgi:uncharacterized protein
MDIFRPIQIFADMVSYGLLGIPEGSYFGNSVNFFIYDVIKIGLLLVAINYFMAMTRYYLPMEKIKDILTRRRWYGLDYLLAALLGVVTPFCSCSSVPLFIGFLGAGIPVGVTFAFLISSPLVNESSLALFPALFGVRTTVVYNLVGITVSILGGMLIQRLRLEKYVDSGFFRFKSRQEVEGENAGQKLPLRTLLSYWWSDGMRITKGIFPYVVLGVGIGALIHGYVPEDLIGKYLAAKQWWVVPVATLVGIPLYANSVSVIPVVEAFVGKGIPLGSAFAFMTATVTLSIPQVLMLKKAMRWQLLLTFYGITTVGIMIIGYLFNTAMFN